MITTFEQMLLSDFVMAIPIRVLARKLMIDKYVNRGDDKTR